MPRIRDLPVTQTALLGTDWLSVDPATGSQTAKITAGNARKFFNDLFFPEDYGTVDLTGTSASDAAVVAALTAAAAAGGGVVYLRNGNWRFSDSAYWPGTCHNVWLLGAGPGARIYATGAIGQLLAFWSGGDNYGNRISDLTLDGNLLVANLASVDGSYWRDTTFERVTFKDMTNVALSADGAHGLLVDDCIGYRSDGRPNGGGITLGGGGSNLRVRASRFDNLWHGVSYNTDNVPALHVEVTNCHVDGHWWQQPYDVGNSGGTVTYTGSTVVDSSNPFTSYVSGYVAVSRIARVLTAIVTRPGTGATYTAAGITDSGATFTGVEYGHIIRTSAQWAIVQKVSGTTVYTGRWYSLIGSLWGVPQPKPANGTAYTIYDVVTGRVQSMTNSTLTINVGWGKLNTGAANTPSAGTRYELLCPHNDARGIFMSNGVHGADISGNVCEATFVEGVFMFCSGSRIMRNQIRNGQDMGITLETFGSNPASGNLIADNHITNQGAAGIWVAADDNNVHGNSVEGTPTGQYAGTVMKCGISVSGSRNLVHGNRLVNAPTHGWGFTSALATHGVILHTGAANNLVTDNVTSGFATGGVLVDGSAGSGNDTATGNKNI